MASKKKKKASYVGAPAIFELELACQQLNDAFPGPDSFGIYHVGSSLTSPDWRDVDLRMIMSDDGFQRLFPDCHMYPNNEGGTWEANPRWLLLTTLISRWLSDISDLPVDFQIQPQTFANKTYDGNLRSAMGLKIMKREEEA